MLHDVLHILGMSHATVFDVFAAPLSRRPWVRIVSIRFGYCLARLSSLRLGELFLCGASYEYEVGCGPDVAQFLGFGYYVLEAGTTGGRALKTLRRLQALD